LKHDRFNVQAAHRTQFRPLRVGQRLEGPAQPVAQIAAFARVPVKGGKTVLDAGVINLLDETAVDNAIRIFVGQRIFLEIAASGPISQWWIESYQSVPARQFGRGR
jgi:hypothetical protein